MHSKWSAIVAVAAAFGLVLGAGFLLQEWNGGMLGERFGLFAGIAIGMVAGAIYCLLTGTSPWRLTGRAPRSRYPTLNVFTGGPCGRTLTTKIQARPSAAFIWRRSNAPCAQRA